MRVSLGLGQDQRIFLCTAKKRASNCVCHSRKVLISSFLTRYQKALSRVNGKKRIDLMEESKDGRGGEETRVDELRVVFLSTEVSPWSKVGGLADVISALPKALAGIQSEWKGDYNIIKTCRVMSVAPMYEQYDDVRDCQMDVPLPEYPLEGICRHASLFETLDDAGVHRVFVKHPMLGMRRHDASRGHPSLTYIEADGGVYDCRHMDIRYDILAWGALVSGILLPNYEENTERIADVAEGGTIASCCGGSTARDVVFVLNDWPSALHVLRLKHIMQGLVSNEVKESLSDIEKRILGSLGRVKTLFCIHNLAYQGVFSEDTLSNILLPPDSVAPLYTKTRLGDILGPTPDEEGNESDTLGITKDLNDVRLDDNTVNFMKGALLCCDQIVTVSPEYAKEIMSDDMSLNCGMGDILHRRGVCGIMNGIDTVEWDTLHDKYLPVDGRFGSSTVSKGKSYMKKAIQQKFGLNVDDKAVLFVFIGRLTEQKGVDVLLRSFTKILPQKEAPRPTKSVEECMTESQQSKLQLAVLGTGDPWMERAVESLEHSFPGHAAGICEFSEEIAHCLLAAADYVIVPSKFEPCGLIAQCAAHYGAVPILTATGGLYDLGRSGIGRLMPKFDTVGESVDVMIEIVNTAVEDYKTDLYIQEQATCMEYDMSWNKSALQWQDIITQVLYM
ncbi:hypothetical protein M9434_002142 [Picochlorum sp. BPE23]|nr:hypothetical protein M9434_002142 [Picochlorum sp. BPE23]